MSVYKEGFSALSQIEANSHRIYDDAADFGALSNPGDAIWNAAQQLIHFYSEEGTRVASRYSTGASVNQEFSLMDEWNTGDTFYFRLYYCSVNKGIKGRDGKRYEGFFTIEALPERTIKGNKVLDY